MTEAIRRSIFRTNKFQRPILNLIVTLGMLMLAMMVTCIAFLYYDIATAIYYPERSVAAVKGAVILSLMVLPLILFLGIFWAYSLSNRLIGPFERIIRELDDVISQNKKRHISARPGDELASEVLKRVNTLIDRMS